MRKKKKKASKLGIALLALLIGEFIFVGVSNNIDLTEQYFKSVRESLVEASGSDIENPSYKEMVGFVREDKTDANTYDWNTYVCEDFANDVIENAREEDIRAGMVYLESPTSMGHAIVCFKTKDKGLYFLEPQLDIIFSKGRMENMLRRGVYDIQTEYGGSYVSYTEYFNMPLSGYHIERWNDGFA